MALPRQERFSSFLFLKSGSDLIFAVLLPGLGEQSFECDL